MKTCTHVLRSRLVAELEKLDGTPSENPVSDNTMSSYAEYRKRSVQYSNMKLDGKMTSLGALTSVAWDAGESLGDAQDKFKFDKATGLFEVIEEYFFKSTKRIYH